VIYWGRNASLLSSYTELVTVDLAHQVIAQLQQQPAARLNAQHQQQGAQLNMQLV